jgi:Lrp/AsnC family transcriptional regulator for asnA, asnC and gidA
MGRHPLDQLDERILQMIVPNARLPLLEVSRVCHVSGAAVHLRVKRLVEIGVLRGSEYIVDPHLVGYETTAYMGLYIQDPGRFPEVVEALREIPEIVECHYTTGQYDLFIKLYAKNNQHLLEIIHSKLQPLGLSRTETLISFGEAFRRSMPTDFDLTNAQSR